MRPVRVSQTGVGNSPWIPLDIYQDPFEPTLAVEVTGTVTYSVVWTVDDVQDPTVTRTAFAGPGNLQAATTNQASALTTPVTAVQLQVTAGTGTAKLTVLQPGVKG